MVLGTTAGAVTRLEQSEAADRIRSDTLRRVADVLGCDLVDLLVPRRPLTAIVHERARGLARSRAAAIEQTMRVEDQAIERADELEDQLAERLLERGGLCGIDE